MASECRWRIVIKTGTRQSFDLVVIGAGPGGYIAAIRGRQLGMTVAAIESTHLGGICLNWGCIPTKALLRSAELIRDFRNADQYGLFVNGEVGFDAGKIVERSRSVATRLTNGVRYLLDKNKVTVFSGHGAIEGRGEGGLIHVGVSVADGRSERLEARHVILATGARARTTPNLQPDGNLIWTYKEAITPPKIPKSLLVVGSGAIGVELASFYRAFGTEVTVAEIADRILPGEDVEVSAFVRKAFERQGMQVLTGSDVTSLEPQVDSVTATIRRGNGEVRQHVERVILALGIVGNTENIGLETTGVRVERKHVVTDAFSRTDEPGIYAIGDLAGPPWLAHKASHEGVACVEKIAGLGDVHPFDPSNVPSCIYCTPQVASVGLTEDAARSRGYAVKVGRGAFAANGKAMAVGHPEGMVKTVFDAATGELLCAHMVGPGVTELIHGFGLARQLEAVEFDLAHAVFPHPTLSEVMHESVLDMLGQALNQ